MFQCWVVENISPEKNDGFRQLVINLRLPTSMNYSDTYSRPIYQFIKRCTTNWIIYCFGNTHFPQNYQNTLLYKTNVIISTLLALSGLAWIWKKRHTLICITFAFELTSYTIFTNYYHLYYHHWSLHILQSIYIYFINWVLPSTSSCHEGVIQYLFIFVWWFSKHIPNVHLRCIHYEEHQSENPFYTDIH